MSSKRYSFLAALRTRLEQITVANGFNTDCGSSILMGEDPIFGPADPESYVAIVVGEDTPHHQAENVASVLSIGIQAIVKADSEAPLLLIEAVIEDIKRAVELEDRTFGRLLSKGTFVRGATRPLERAAGAEYVGAVVEYRGQLVEGWGTP